MAQGLNGGQQQTHIEISQRVAARFTMSISVSGASLNAFAGASEATQQQNAQVGVTKELMDKLLSLTNDALSKANETLN